MGAEHASSSTPGGLFPQTAWSLIAPQSGAAAEVRDRAMEHLARSYLEPVHAWFRAVAGPTDAADLAQEFFLWMIETGFASKADPSRGRFRAFLKTGLRNFHTDAARRARARKRGGGAAPIPLDTPGDDALAVDPVDPRPRPEEALDDAWRTTVVRAALDRTEAALAQDGRARQFAVFRDYFLKEGDATDYRTLAASHGITTTDVSNWLARAKEKYRNELRDVVRETVTDPAELTRELRWLLGGGES